jgi:hypothetical protein
MDGCHCLAHAGEGSYPDTLPLGQDPDFAVVPCLTQLTRLNVHTSDSRQFLGQSGLALRPAELTALSSLTAMAHLDLAHQQAAGRDLRFLRPMAPRLTTLVLNGDEQLPEEAWNELGSLTSLRVLTLCWRPGVLRLEALSGLTMLEVLRCQSCSEAISPEGAAKHWARGKRMRLAGLPVGPSAHAAAIQGNGWVSHSLARSPPWQACRHCPSFRACEPWTWATRRKRLQTTSCSSLRLVPACGSWGSSAATG